MISVETIKHASHTSEQVVYNNASPQWLFKRLRARVHADERTFAAAGLLRAVMDAPLDDRRLTEYHEGFAWAKDALLRTRRGRRSTRDIPPMNEYVASLPNVYAQLDSVTISATRTNDPTGLAAVLEKQRGVLPNKLVIGLGHGGVIAAADTFLAMSGENVFYPARYSRAKHHDKLLRLSLPEIDRLTELARDKSVIVIDEDSATHQTMETAVVQLKNALRTDVVLGATPVIAKSPEQFDPQITSTDDLFWSKTKDGVPVEW